jgi:uncharacterized protein YabE (DUF348 family)
MHKFKRLTRKYQAIGRRKIKRAHPLKGHPLVVPVITFLGLFFLSAVGMVLFGAQTMGASDSRVVTITIDGEQQTLPTRAKTVSDLLKRLDVTVGDKDLVEPSLNTSILEDNMSITVQKARPVTIIDSGRKVTVLSPYQQPRKVVENAGIELYKEDGINAAASSDMTKDRIIGEQVVVERAVPANINLYGNSIAVRTRAKTVGELLDQKSIKTLKGDTVEPARNTKLSSNTQVFVVRMGKKVLTSEEAIPAPVANEDDPTLTIGATTVKQAGSDGKKLVTYEVELRNGVEVSRKVLQEVVAAEPVRRVIAKGTKVVVTGGRAEWLAAAGISPSEYYAVDYIVGRESGWCPTKWQGEYGGCPAYHGTPSSAGLGYGLCQATPGWKMASAGADWAVNPITQLQWCTGYARQRYGSWTGAYNFWIVNHWW